MLKTREKSTARKPLADISNGGKRSRPGKKKAPAADRNDGDGAIDRLLLARSDLSDLIAQVDELVTRALANKTMDKSGGQVIESFRNVLCDMHSSLKAWVPRLQHAFADTSAKTEHKLRHTTNACSVSAEYGDRNALPNSESKDKLEVSPSPLVSWRAGTCTVDCGRQLFLLTPLPKSTLLSSKRPGLSRSMLARNTIADCHVSCGIPTLANDVKNGDGHGIVVEWQHRLNFLNLARQRKLTTGTDFVSPLIVSNQKSKTCGILTLANDVKNGDDHGIVEGVATSFEFSKPCTTAGYYDPRELSSFLH
ncbi:hypothetical protein J5N97_025919 [Dioscorea zingiberensis]|uniref:Uncharacterized protein n=1 Tax=Dioscorea zingiberensis TaxID=325984 RepID=A0A9D5C1F7_9LILI|nr:hypothetical protein J5N97_025919 [Dioscorea zingiberensis]